MQIDTVEFRILGPVEIWLNGKQVWVGGPGPRGVLATLLLSRDKAVTAMQLVEVLWGDDPPATMAGRVHVLVSELRRTLSTAGLGSRVIRTQSGGYVLDRGIGVLDFDTFRDLAAAGRKAFEDGEHRQAAELFGDALAIWPGDALEGLTSPFFQQESARLLEQRLDVVEEYAAARLKLRRLPTPDVLYDLSEIVARNPHRETPVALLMKALHRVGRKPEALHLYRNIRARLRDDLGLDPSQQLQRLELAILRDEIE